MGDRSSNCASQGSLSDVFQSMFKKHGILWASLILLEWPHHLVSEMVLMYIVLFNGPSMNTIGKHLTPCCQVLGMCCGWMLYGRCYSCGLLNVQMTIICLNYWPLQRIIRSFPNNPLTTPLETCMRV